MSLRLLLVVLLFALLPAGSRAAYQGEYPYSIVASTGMVADVVMQVAGERADVTTIISAGLDPHLYKPSRSDVMNMSRADLIFYNGLLLEGQMGDVFVRMARQRPVYAVTELLDESTLLQDGEYNDPHVWMNVRKWMLATEVVRDALIAFDPENAEEYRANAADYRAELEQLHAYVERVLGSIPEEKRVLITAHDAFNYLGAEYGLEVMGIQGLSTESEAGLQDINQLVDLIVERGIGAVFIETTINDKNVRALIEGAASRGHTVTIGGELFSDAMGSQGTYEGTYIGMIDHNATVIARALGGEAPPRGMNNKLAVENGI